MILVSACLLGYKTKYNSSSNTVKILTDSKHLNRFIPVCPEILGGLTIPRPPAEIINGTGSSVLSGLSKVVNINNQDITRHFIIGATKVSEYLKTNIITCAILKERSPSCGTSYIYDGSFTGKIITGHGVTAAMLQLYNIPLYSEENITAELLAKIIEQDLAADY